jgi:hypothetical protein
MMAVSEQSRPYQREMAAMKTFWVREVWPLLMVPCGFVLTLILMGGVVGFFVALIYLAWASLRM